MSGEKRLTVVWLLNLVLVTGLVPAGLNQARVVAGALPPLYGMAGKIVTDLTPGLGSRRCRSPRGRPRVRGVRAA